MTDATTNTIVDADFAGRRRKFLLDLGGIGELERLARAGIGEVMLRLGSHRFYHADVRETVRLGLEGGGLSEAEATALVMRYLDPPNRLVDHLALAMRIVEATVNGINAAMPARDGDDEAEKKTSGASSETSPSTIASAP